MKYEGSQSDCPMTRHPELPEPLVEAEAVPAADEAVYEEDTFGVDALQAVSRLNRRHRRHGVIR